MAGAARFCGRSASNSIHKSQFPGAVWREQAAAYCAPRWSSLPLWPDYRDSPCPASLGVQAVESLVLAKQGAVVYERLSQACNAHIAVLASGLIGLTQVGWLRCKCLVAAVQ